MVWIISGHNIPCTSGQYLPFLQQLRVPEPLLHHVAMSQRYEIHQSTQNLSTGSPGYGPQASKRFSLQSSRKWPIGHSTIPWANFKVQVCDFDTSLGSPKGSPCCKIEGSRVCTGSSRLKPTLSIDSELNRMLEEARPGGRERLPEATMPFRGQLRSKWPFS
ncbi:uncharacterized protein BT62DRAFT_770154 [Guyanagaster necrorhizus]|uniref:Uncharacterized protein n=1 Tax=Guyanagaster necrorhizus TaxID=856835 RepID=A0A9P7VET2_9AGAR|nr:uncharacterized protein BT62DRAFT_770154 [Guyanagaster necrorhizus MCA 3950]KAG7439277.1 hypothetical protein BT62DRAFT_770154 [Guyanagaster necrorhizus MCA 3950]